ncbi:tetratricopeptide repeat protein [Hymenobacter sp. UYCo722]|uniref:tetratricopeptide repeat protein n=1 Tax=Hymenobacter sp. UYCo722 TaxID=3156335 RepID=UPI00339A35D1
MCTANLIPVIIPGFYGRLWLLLALLLPVTGWAQEKVSKRDAAEMSLQAEAKVEDLQTLLNSITFNDVIDSDMLSYKKDSYTPTRNQIFVDGNVIVEDDTDPDYSNNTTKDLIVSKYLDVLDLQYVKTADFSILFSKIQVSKIKKKQYFYVKVTFEEVFSSTNKLNGKTYQPRMREALVQLVNQGNGKWQALIAGLTFYEPSSADAAITEEDVQITSDATATASIVSDEDFKREKEDLVFARQQEEKKKQAAFEEYIALGNTYAQNKQYKEALDLFLKAKDIRSLVPSLDKRILDSRRLAAIYTFEGLKSRADQAKSERRYSDALQNYKQAVDIKPEALPLVSDDMAFLTRKLAEISLPKNKLEAGNYQGAIDACDKVLKENKKSSNDLSEFYFIKGQAYEQMAEKMALATKQPADTRNLERALENYTLAIQSFPNYSSARLARAAFYAKYKHDYENAVTDYDAVTNNTLDYFPEKPRYLVVKGKWKILLKNTSGALDDFAKATVLDPNAVSPRFATGELLYNLQRYQEAVISFDAVLKLDPRNSSAYYFRGLSQAGLKDAASAGGDFGSGEKLGLEPYQLKMVEKVSNDYLEAGQKAFKAGLLPRADSQYNNAIAVRRCNSKAWHGKAEIRFVTAEQQAANPHSTASRDNYNQAIELYQKALECDSRYSDASYKTGQAYHRNANYEQALKSYDDAIKSDANNVEAFIGRGNTRLALKQYSEAIPDFSRAVTLLQFNLVAARKNSQKDEIMRISNRLSVANQLISESWYHKRDFAKAILNADQALGFNEKNAEALYWKGLAAEGQKDVSKALKCYAEAIRYTPHYKYYYANGKALLGAEKYEQAISNFTQTIRLDTLPIIRDSRYLRGLSYFRSRQLDLAFKDFTEYNKRAEAADSLFFADFGMLNLYLNHDADAIEQFQHALSQRPNQARALYGLGCAYAKAGQFDKALKQFELAFRTHRLRKEDVRLEEETFLVELNKVKAHRNQYAQLKKSIAPPTASVTN